MFLTAFTIHTIEISSLVWLLSDRLCIDNPRVRHGSLTLTLTLTLNPNPNPITLLPYYILPVN